MEGLRRDRRGCSSKQLRDWPDAQLSSFVGPLAAHAYIQHCIRTDPANVVQICTRSNKQWDVGVWQLEHLRQVALELSGLMVLLINVCTKESCPQMKASDEWVFLCAAHRLPIECCAIDYITHTLEGTTAVLNSHRWFPERGAPPPQEAKKVFQSIARRLHRIFAHVFFHHHHVFTQFENDTHLCRRFLHLIQQHHWIRPHQMIIPLDYFTTLESDDVDGDHEAVARQPPQRADSFDAEERGDRYPTSIDLQDVSRMEEGMDESETCSGAGQHTHRRLYDPSNAMDGGLGGVYSKSREEDELDIDQLIKEMA